MWYIYLDESGDLGFDFVNKKPSNFFTICILVVKGISDNRALINGVKKTLRRKLNPKDKRKRIVPELKASNTSINVKEYFFRPVAGIPFKIFSTTLNKRRAFEKLAEEKHRIYNYISRSVLEQIPFGEAETRIELIIDKTKNILQIQEFNTYVIIQLQGKLDPTIPLDIYHRNSQEDFGLQAVDVFSWGIFRKYERADTE